MKNREKMTGFDRGNANQKVVNNVLWKPHYKQALALSCTAFEMLFGGAAGGGKSDFLLIDFWAGVMKYGKHWQGILFRRTYGELIELMKRAAQLYVPLGGRFINKTREYVFRNGASIRFMYLEHDSDVNRYQGHQYTWIGFDELGNYPSDYAWRYMISRCRSPAGVPCYMRATANPGGVGHAWIKARFIDGFEPNKIHRPKEEGGASTTRCFIPSRIEDNPTLMRNDPGYAERLKNLPKNQYRALRLGDWDIFAGQVFDEWRRDLHVVKPFALPQDGWRRFYCLDWGSFKPYAIAKLAVNRDGKVIQYGEIYGCRKDEYNRGTKEGSSEVAAKVWEMAANEGVTELIADPACWNKTDNSFPAPITAYQESGFKCIRANNDRIPGLNNFHNYLKEKDENGTPMFQVFSNCIHTIRTITALLPDPSRPEDVDSKLEDHLYDAIRYGLMSRFATQPQRYFENRQTQYERTATGNKEYSPLEDW
jgi:hypothetical protein